MAPHSSTLAWKIPWMEEPGRLWSMVLQRVGHDWATSLSLFTFMHWRRKWQPTPVFLPGESQGRGRLMQLSSSSRVERGLSSGSLESVGERNTVQSHNVHKLWYEGKEQGDENCTRKASVQTEETSLGILSKGFNSGNQLTRKSLKNLEN